MHVPFPPFEQHDPPPEWDTRYGCLCSPEGFKPWLWMAQHQRHPKYSFRHTCATITTQNQLRIIAASPLYHLFSCRKSHSCVYRPKVGFCSLESWWISEILSKKAQLGAWKTWSHPCFVCYQAEHMHSASLAVKRLLPKYLNKCTASAMLWGFFPHSPPSPRIIPEKLYLGL